MIGSAPSWSWVTGERVFPGCSASGPIKATLAPGAWRRWTREHLGVELEVIDPGWRNLQRYFPDFLDEMGFQPGFHVLPRRWVVERTFAWLGRSRRLSRDDERLPTSSEALIYLTSIRLLLHRVT